jgi:hypothetical protein
MPELSAFAKGAALQAIEPVSVSLHMAYDADGGNELSAGSPPYARLPATFSLSVDTVLTLDAPLTFDVPGGVIVAWVGLWDLAGNFLGMAPFNSDNTHLFVIDPDDTSTLLLVNTALSNDRTVVVWSSSLYTPPKTASLSDVNEGQAYYIVNSTSSSVQLATTLGGTPLVFTNKTAGYLQEITTVTFDIQSRLTLSSMFIYTANSP